jgi:hypothetical protein
MEHYCHNCESTLYDDELVRYEEPDVNWVSYKCGKCGCDDIEELSHEVWVRIFTDAIERLRKLRKQEQSSFPLNRKLSNVEDVFTQVLEYVQEL